MTNRETLPEHSSIIDRKPLTIAAIVYAGLISLAGIARECTFGKQPDKETCALLRNGENLDTHSQPPRVLGLPGEAFVYWESSRAEDIATTCATDHGIAVTRQQIVDVVRNGKDPDHFLPADVEREALGIIK